MLFQGIRSLIRSGVDKLTENPTAVLAANGVSVGVSFLQQVELVLKVAVLAVSFLLTCVSLYYKVKRKGKPDGQE